MDEGIGVIGFREYEYGRYDVVDLFRNTSRCRLVDVVFQIRTACIFKSQSHFQWYFRSFYITTLQLLLHH